MYQAGYRYILASLRIFLVGSLFGLFFTFPTVVFAETSSFRSANIITTDGDPFPYINLENCSVTDGNTCDRQTGLFYANLYFRDFGTYDDFGIPSGAVIKNVRIRVTGKANVAMYVALSRGTTFGDNCQFPSDIWTLTQLNSSTIKTQTFVTPVMSPWSGQSVNGACLRAFDFQNKNFIWKINYANNINWSANIDNFEIAFDYDLPPTPTPTPTITPSPTPSGPAPFLDLPWDYEGKGQTFTDAALSMTSFFDHEYPLLSSSLSEPGDSFKSLMRFEGFRSNDSYSSHDGYDYAIKANVNIGDAAEAITAAMVTPKTMDAIIAIGCAAMIPHPIACTNRSLLIKKLR